MTLRDRFEQLEPREQKLLMILIGVFVVMVVFLIPLLVKATVSSREDENEQMRAAIDEIVSSRGRIQAQQRENASIVERYQRKAPALAGYLDKLASAIGIEIPESQDRAPVPHGKKYEERMTKIVLRKVGMLNLATFMERIENSGYPIRVSQLNIRKRPTEPDSFDVTMIVSAFDRNATKPSGGNADEGEEEEEEEVEE